MKKLLFAGLGLLIGFGTIGQVKSKMVFQAEIANRNTDSLIIRNVQNGTIITKMFVNKQGVFKDSFAVEEGIYMLYDGKEYAKIFIKNGYDFKLKMDAKQFFVVMQFSGSGAAENNDLMQYSFLKSKGDYDTLLASDEATFKKVVEENKAAHFKKLDSKKLDSGYVALQKKNIEMELFGLTQYYNQIVENNKLIGSISPVFNFGNYQGGTTKLKDFKGKYVYIDVWATWCGPCIAEIPSLKMLEEKYQDKNIAFVSISIDKMKDIEKWRNMVKAKNLGGVQVIADNDWNSKFVLDYKITSIPRFILIDPSGKIIKGDAARPSNPELQAELDLLLN